MKQTIQFIIEEPEQFKQCNMCDAINHNTNIECHNCDTILAHIQPCNDRIIGKWYSKIIRVYISKNYTLEQINNTLIDV